MYQKQFKITKAHYHFIEQTLEEWLKLVEVQRSDSLYSSPIFCIPKKQCQGLQIVQDFRELNQNYQNYHINKYPMKEINTGDIGRANFQKFSTLDLTSEFWQMKLDEQLQLLTSFTIPGQGQFQWISLPMGCPASFQRLMEGVLCNLQNVIVYINILLVQSDTHEKHLQILEQVLDQLPQNNLKIKLDKCNKEVSYWERNETQKKQVEGHSKCKSAQ